MAWLQSPVHAAVCLLQHNPSCQSERNQLVRADTTNRNKCHSVMFRGTGFMDNFKQYLCPGALMCSFKTPKSLATGKKQIN